MMPSRGDNQSRGTRYETKVPLERKQYQELTQILLQLGLRPRKMYPDRLVQTIYLDTPDFDDYFDNVSGISRRRKIRIRWYGADLQHMVLEVKRKVGKVSDKRAIELQNPERIVPTDRLLLHKLIKKNTIESPIALSPLYRPTLAISYKRSYFELNPGIRMTIDREIEYKKIWPVVSFKLTRSPVDVVLEFKYPIDQQSEFKQLLRDFPYRVFRHSKYVVGIDTVVAR